MLILAGGYTLLVYAVGSVWPGNYRHHLNLEVELNTSDHMRARITDIANYSKVDLLIIGSSHACRGFDPRVFEAYGLRIFNLGSSAQTPMHSEYLLKKYITALNPDTVIFEVFPKIFTWEGVEASMDILTNDRFDAGMTRLMLQHPTPMPLNSFLYHKVARKTPEPLYGTYLSGGYIARKEAHAHHQPEPVPEPLVIPEHQLEAFYNIIRFLKKRDIPYILVQAPYTWELYATFQGVEDFDRLMEANGPYYNYNEMDFLQDSSFYFDQDHLNQKGVEAFNRHFIEHVVKR